jgi:hypothetical protein
MPTRDPVDSLVFLARCAADAGEDWRTRLRGHWLPQTIATTPRPVLAAALAEWREETTAEGDDLAPLLEATVIAALAEQGYD